MNRESPYERDVEKLWGKPLLLLRVPKERREDIYFSSKQRYALVRLLWWFSENPFQMFYSINHTTFTSEFNRRICAILWLNASVCSWDRGTKGEIIPSIHHLVARSRWWGNPRSNKKILHRRIHDDFHTVFWVFTPIEQLALLTLLFEDVMCPTVFSELYKLLLSENQESFYSAWVVKGRIRY